MVRHWTDAAQALYHHWHLPVGAPLDEFFEAAEFDNVQPDLMHLILIVQQNRHLAVALHARYRVDDNAPQVFGVLGSFKREGHAIPR